MSTSFEERLEIARTFVAFCQEHPDEIRGRMGVAERDQVEAAARDAERWMERLPGALTRCEPERFGRTELTRRDTSEGAEAIAHMLAAIWALVPCVHLRKVPHQPVVGRLALHRLDCRRCCRTLRHPPPDEADRCDWCGTRGHVQFTPITLQLGPLMAAGDACDDCAAVLKP